MVRATHSFTREGELELIYVPEGETPPEGAELLAPDYWDAHDLATAKNNLWHLVKLKREAVQYGGCATTLGEVDTSEAAKLNISGSVQMAMLAMQAQQPFEVLWTMQDNTRVPHDAPAMIAMGQAVGVHVATCHAVAATLREQISAATTLAELNAIDIEAAPWPGQATPE